MDQVLKTDINLKATELRLGLPGTEADVTQISLAGPRCNKRPLYLSPVEAPTKSPQPPKAQIVGWPPIRSQRKSSLQSAKESVESSGHFIKVSMDGAPFLRKIDLKLFSGYAELLKAIENMFKLTIGEYSESEGYKGSEYAPAYEDKDGDLMLVGDVPWEMFVFNCKKLRIMKGLDAKGLGYATL